MAFVRPFSTIIEITKAKLFRTNAGRIECPTHTTSRLSRINTHVQLKVSIVELVFDETVLSYAAYGIISGSDLGF